ncbi:MAG: PKD domain-containing protein, partial [Methanoregula sp.]|nr:PKD domain-containing protein [Methanoregula sp.]
MTSTSDLLGMGKIAIDSSGNVYVTGLTYSSDFPTTTGAYQVSKPGTTSYSDCVVAKYTSDGAKVYATFLGGSVSDRCQAIAVDSVGSAYVAGWTKSPSFPNTTGVLQKTINGSGSYQNGFLTKLNASGQSLDYSTFYGGKSASDAGATGIALDSSGNAYVSGYTTATDFPVKYPFQATNAGNTEGYIFKVNPAGSTYLWASYLGGQKADQPYGIAYDGRGNVTVVGSSASGNFPTVNPLSGSGVTDSYTNGFISIISEIPVASFTATPFSGNAPFDVQFTDTSSDYPTAWNWSFGDGSYSEAQNPVHTYTNVQKYTVTLTATNAFGSGTTAKTDYIQGLSDKPPVASFTVNKTLGKFPLIVQFTDTSLNAPTSWLWDFGDGGMSTLQNPIYSFPSPGTYTVSLNASNSYGFNQSTQTNMIQVVDTDSTPLP